MGWLMVAMLFLLVVFFTLVLSLYSDVHKLKRELHKWESEYWLLRYSDAISGDYEVHLSFREYGKTDAIRKKDEEVEDD